MGNNPLESATDDGGWQLVAFSAVGWEGLDFGGDSIPTGRRYLLFGKNNSGKTSFVRLLSLVSKVTASLPWRCSAEWTPRVDRFDQSHLFERYWDNSISWEDSKNPRVKRWSDLHDRRIYIQTSSQNEPLSENDSASTNATECGAPKLRHGKVLRFPITGSGTSERELIPWTYTRSPFRLELSFLHPQVGNLDVAIRYIPDDEGRYLGLGDISWNFSGPHIEARLEFSHRWPLVEFTKWQKGNRAPAGECLIHEPPSEFADETGLLVEVGSWELSVDRMDVGVLSQYTLPNPNPMSRWCGIVGTPMPVLERLDPTSTSQAGGFSLRFALDFDHSCVYYFCEGDPQELEYGGSERAAKLAEPDLDNRANQKFQEYCEKHAIPLGVLSGLMPHLSLLPIAQNRQTKSHGDKPDVWADFLSSPPLSRNICIYGYIPEWVNRVVGDREEPGLMFRYYRDFEPKYSANQIGKGILWIYGMIRKAVDNSCRVFEHPEHFLHPGAAADLVEQLMQQTPFSVFETHSEAILFRTQRLVRQHILDADDTHLLVFNRQRLSGEDPLNNYITRIPFQPDGELRLQFPDGFAEIYWGEKSAGTEDEGPTDELTPRYW